MAKLDINLWGVANLSPKLKTARIQRVDSWHNNIVAVKNSLDQRVRDRNNIEARINKVCSRITGISDRLRVIENILSYAYKQISNTEVELGKMADLYLGDNNSGGSLFKAHSSSNVKAFEPETQNSRHRGGGKKF